MLIDGQCGAIDMDGGIAMLESAARNGHLAAQHDLGLQLLMQAAAPEERHWGLYWLGAAAGQGDGFSAISIGMIHERGMHGISVDVCVALDWYEAGMLLGFDALADHYETLMIQWRNDCY